MAKALILGAGFGGLAAAHEIKRRAPDAAVTLVDRSDGFVVGATKTWVMLGDRTPEEVVRARERVAKVGVEFLEAEVTAIDPASRTVTTAAGTLEADYIVVALGAELGMDVVPGLETAETFYTLEGAIRLRDVLTSFESGRLVLLIPAVPIKCPPAPYEAALLLHEHFERRGIRDRVELSLHTVEPAPMPTAGPGMGSLIRGELEGRGIGYFPGHTAEAVDPEAKVVRFAGGEEAVYDLLVAIPAHRAPTVVREAGLAGEAGWIQVDAATMETWYPGVYAAGDVTVVPLPGRYAPDRPLVLPKAGVFAEKHGRVAGAHIAARIRGEESPEAFDGVGFCYLEVGAGEAIRADGEFFALPHPSVAGRPADREQYEDKVRWVEGILETYL